MSPDDDRPPEELREPFYRKTSKRTIPVKGARQHTTIPSWTQRATAFFFGWTALGKGIRDGGRGLPGESHARPSHRTKRNLGFLEHETVDLTDREVAAICAPWRKRKEPLDGVCKLARTELVYFLEAGAAIRDQHRKLGFKEPHRDIPLAGYVAYVAVAAVGEFPLNQAAAQILRQGSLETAMIAATLCVIGIMAAHGAGKLARQWKTNGDLSFRRTAMFACFSAIIVLPAAAGFLRHGFLRWSAGSADVMSSLALAAFNGALLIVAAIGSYLAHETDYQLEKLWCQWRRVQRRMRRAWQRWNSVSGKYDALRAVTLEKILGLHAETRARLDEYRRGDAAARQGGQVPTYFGQPLVDELFRPIDPELITELDPAPTGIDDVLTALGFDVPDHEGPAAGSSDAEAGPELHTEPAGPKVKPDTAISRNPVSHRSPFEGARAAVPDTITGRNGDSPRNAKQSLAAGTRRITPITENES